MEGERAKVLRVMAREGNALSAVIREAWDNGNLRVMTKNDPVSATGAHISIVAHITFEELRDLLRKAEAFNGFANRFLWVAAKRSRLLPESTDVDPKAWTAVIESLKDAVTFARSNVQMIGRDESASRRWCEVYERLSEERWGMHGAVTSRAEAQVVRLAAIYAVLDQSTTVRIEHLNAALEVWRYCDESARVIFASDFRAGAGRVRMLTDRIANLLAESGSAGRTRTEIRDEFQRNVDGAEVGKALDDLESTGQARRESETTGGRPAERWFWVGTTEVAGAA
jgi:hypothetical protein